MAGNYIVGGGGNSIINVAGYSGILGGTSNLVNGSAQSSALVGGNANVMNGTNSAISGGTTLTLSSLDSFMGGGVSNFNNSYASVIDGGINVLLSGGTANFSGGGTNNSISAAGLNSAIVGGSGNSITAGLTGATFNNFVANGLIKVPGITDTANTTPFGSGFVNIYQALIPITNATINLGSNVTTFGTLFAAGVSATNSTFTNFISTNIVGTTATITNLATTNFTATTATITLLKATSATITNFLSSTATITNILTNSIAGSSATIMTIVPVSGQNLLYTGVPTVMLYLGSNTSNISAGSNSTIGGGTFGTWLAQSNNSGMWSASTPSRITMGASVGGAGNYWVGGTIAMNTNGGGVTCYAAKNGSTLALIGGGLTNANNNFSFGTIIPLALNDYIELVVGLGVTAQLFGTALVNNCNMGTSFGCYLISK